MATANPFAYNTGTTISGTSQLGDLSIGTPISGFTNNPQYWNGPNEDLGYVITVPISGNTQPTPISGVTASVAFYQSKFLTSPSFLKISNYLGNKQGQPPFASSQAANDWLTSQGYWTSFVSYYLLQEDLSGLLQEDGSYILF